MRDGSAKPPAEGGRSQPPTATRIVSLDDASDPMRAFASEGAPATTNLVPIAAREVRVSVLPPQPEASTRAVSPPPAAAVGLDWRNASLVALMLIVLAQAGFIGFWIFSGSAVAAPPDDGSVSITSEPAGAPVTIDGVPSGVTPLTVSLPAASHLIEIGEGPQLRGHELSVVAGGTASLHVGLAPVEAAEAAATSVGGLQVTTDPAGARVFVDGAPRGVAPVTVPNLSVGDHTVTVRAGTGQAISRTVSIKAATVSSLVVSMNAAAASAPGWLAVTSAVPLQIISQGSLVGTSDIPRVMLPAGTHDLELVNAALDYRVTRRVEISAGQTTAISQSLPMGTLSLNAMPWAEVWIDGRRAGETPIGNFSIAIGTHEVVFRHPELGEQRRTVTVGASAPARFGVDMRQQ